MSKAIDEMRAELACMTKILDVLEPLDDDEQRLRVLAAACAALGHYEQAQAFLEAASARASAKAAREGR